MYSYGWAPFFPWCSCPATLGSEATPQARVPLSLPLCQDRRMKNCGSSRTNWRFPCQRMRMHMHTHMNKFLHVQVLQIFKNEQQLWIITPNVEALLERLPQCALRVTMQVPMSASVQKSLGKPKLDESGIMIENALDARGSYHIPTKEVCFSTNSCTQPFLLG